MIGSLRVGKTAKYLHKSGHDIRVVTADDLLVDPSQEVEIPDRYVLRTPWVRLDTPGVWLLGGREHVRKKGYERSGRTGRWLEFSKPLYRMLVQFPDAQAGWMPYAMSRTIPWLDGWKPDIIVASALPFSSNWIAAYLSKKMSVPWVSELRDFGGVDQEPLDSFTALRRPLDAWAFNKNLSGAAGLITVSKPMAAWLSERFPQTPNCCVYNGFDRDDFPKDIEVPYNDGHIHITHTGSLYSGLRDPRPLFQALTLLGEQRRKIHVHFFGRYTQFAANVAAEENVSSSVHIHSSIPYTQSLKTQMSSDFLLLLMINKPAHDGGYTGKIFEYLAAQRPILALGRHQNAACSLIQKRNAGFVSLQPQKIADQLKTWLKIKEETGSIPALDQEVSKGFSRLEQTQIFEQFLFNILEKKRSTN